ncbi:hypothetical protein GGR56DRAFT_216854 [Xylariaceae sp. FL0804]|nr:hypothetical protein GGR56DRAFT_216854 [Xylariaceae sp. FL0804]
MVIGATGIRHHLISIVLSLSYLSGVPHALIRGYTDSSSFVVVKKSTWCWPVPLSTASDLPFCAPQHVWGFAVPSCNNYRFFPWIPRESFQDNELPHMPCASHLSPCEPSTNLSRSPIHSSVEIFWALWQKSCWASAAPAAAETCPRNAACLRCDQPPAHVFGLEVLELSRLLHSVTRPINTPPSSSFERVSLETSWP